MFLLCFFWESNIMSTEVRFASFNAFLNRSNEGELIENLSTPDDTQVQDVAEIIQRTNPDIILLNEFDFDENSEAIQIFQENYLSVSQNGVDPVEYPYVYLAPSNTGIPSGFDFDNDGTTDGPGDAFGFGFFPGQFGMVLLSKYPILEEEVRTFQEFLWKDMPDAMLPDNPETPEPLDYYSPEELEVFRLSSKNHWDVPIEVNGEIIHVLASHPTPPVFDGEEDRNGTRNFDEIRFWADYITPGNGEYIYDDNGNFGGLTPGDRFVIMGDQNADPYDGDSTPGAIQQLLNNSFVNISATPASVGGEDAAIRQGGANLNHLGDPSLDTADFNDAGAGNLRVDYVLPSANLEITDTAVFWPDSDDPLFDLVGEGFPVVSSDHRLVYADVAVPEVPPNIRQTVTDIEFLGEVVFETGFEFENTEVGGISGITYNPFQDTYYALSDDRGTRSSPIPEAGSLTEYIGYSNDSYFIEVPDNEINDFFAWDENYPDLISAHRGGFVPGFPENAIETFENTLTITPALLEVDVRRTADGEWVLIHDETLDRTTTGTGLVAETTLAEIQTLQLVDNDGNVTDFQVPTLQDALEWAEGRTILELDLKSDEFFVEVVEIITELDAEDQVRFITQNIEQAIAIYDLNPEIHLGVFITADNQAEIFEKIEAAPFNFENVSAFTGTRPQSQDFYETLHDQGIVAIQGLFGNQDFFGESTFINDLTAEQRTELFETVYSRGGDVIASDFSQSISELLNYSQSPLSRYYTVDIDLTDSHLNDGDVVFTDVTSLLDADGNPFIPGELDPEGIALTTFGTVFISSEGDVSPNRGEDGIIDPFVNEFSLTGQEIRSLPVPEKFLPEIEDTNNNGMIDEGDTPISGIQRNRAFENLTITPDQRTLYTATEGALTQDLVTEDGVNPSRIIQYDLTTGEPVEEFLYFPDEFESTFGLVELVALDNSGTLLSLERTFSPEAGNTLRLFEVNTEFATNIAPETALTDLETLNTIAPVEKRLLLDFDELGIRLDNSEAVSFGPTLEDGRQSLIVVSDNNFNAGNQITQFLGFALDIEPAPQPKLVGFASLPADTFADGPDSGEGVSSAERTGPFPGQPVGGWSGVQFADEDSYWFLVDSLFGGDSDTLARIYKVDPNFAGLENGDGTVELEEEFITLSDPNNFVPFEIRNADDPERPLTGTDFDTEALVVGANGDLWVGDEYGPYLLHFDPNGVLLKAPIPTPEITIDGAVEGEFVRAPQNPEVESGEAQANLAGSRGFEGIAYSPDRSILYPILEAPVDGDPENSLRIYQYDIAAGEYASELVGLYPLDNPGDTPTFQLGDFTPINDHEFLVIERDDFEAEEAFFKKVFKIDISEVDENGFVKKEEIIDLLNIADPDDLNGDNSLAFDLPITSVEDVLVYDENTVLVSVDNNYPFGDFATGRPPELDNNEIILVELPEPLDPERSRRINLDPLLGVNGFIPEANTLPNGVASGDTTQDSTVLWTRSLAEGEVIFEYSTDADFNSIVGTVTATVEETNIPVKVEVTGLEAGTDYYYRVTDAAGTTAEGIFETAAEVGTQAGLSFGVTGDWRGELAPYPAITNVAEQELDFFVEHGDTIYADIGSPAVINPDGTRKEQVETLDEYRAKHNEVYSERFGLNAWADVRSSTSILATIDDHEVINDFAGGAPASSDERFPETEGLINDTELFENGLQTFQEYNPLRDDFYGETGSDRTDGERKLYRYNTYGSDAAVMVLDTRSFRDEAIAGPEDFTNPEQVAQVLTQTLTEDITMLGEVQLEDLKQDLVAADHAGITWKFVMVPEPMQNIFPGINTDAFEGYGKERTEILKFLTENEIDNVVFVAADVHTTFVNNLTYQEEPFGEQIPTNIFGVTTGAVAFDAPTGEFLGNLFVSGNPEAEALYNSLPIAPDTDNIPDDKDDFVEQAINSTLLEPLGFDPLGLDNNLPQAEGLIDAELIQGDYFVGHTYGWTQFDIDPQTQQLTVTTYGIEAYTEDELLALRLRSGLTPSGVEALENTEDILSRTPEVVSQFVVNPVEDNSQMIEGTDENDTLTGSSNHDTIAGNFGNDLIDGRNGNDVLRGDANSRDSGGSVGGNDTINGGSGDDRIGGKAGNDILNGDEGDDAIWGDDGDDILRGGLGNDTLTGDNFSGGSGSDTFILAVGEGTDTLVDFEVGVDFIGLAEGLTPEQLAIAQVNQNTEISVANETLAILSQVNAETLITNNPFVNI